MLRIQQEEQATEIPQEPPSQDAAGSRAGLTLLVPANVSAQLLAPPHGGLAAGLALGFPTASAVRILTVPGRQ